MYSINVGFMIYFTFKQVKYIVHTYIVYGNRVATFINQTRNSNTRRWQGMEVEDFKLLK